MEVKVWESCRKRKQIRAIKGIPTEIRICFLMPKARINANIKQPLTSDIINKIN